MATINGISTGADNPTVGGSTDLWGGILNSELIVLGSEAKTKTENLNFADKDLTRPILKDYGEKATSVSSSSNTLTLDITDGNHFYCVLDENTTLAFSNPSPTGNLCGVTLEITQDGTGGRTLAFPASVEWAGGTAPTLTDTAGATDVFVFLTRDAGTTWRASILGQNFS